MNAIRIRKQINSETLHLPELKEMIGRTVDIIVMDPASVLTAPFKDPGCFAALPPPGSFDPRELEAMREDLTTEEFDALEAIASQGGPDVQAILELRAASMI